MGAAAELYTTPGSIWVFVCVGVRLTFALMMHSPCGLLTMRRVGWGSGAGGRESKEKEKKKIKHSGEKRGARWGERERDGWADWRS